MARCTFSYDANWLKELCIELETAEKFLGEIMLLSVSPNQEECEQLYEELKKKVPSFEKLKEVEEYFFIMLDRLCIKNINITYAQEDIADLMDKLIAAEKIFSEDARKVNNHT